MDHRIEQEHTMEIDKLAFPRQDRILGFLKGARGGISSHPLSACFAYLPDHANRGFQAFHESLFGLGEIDRTVLTFVNDTIPIILCGVGRMISNISRVAYRALES